MTACNARHDYNDCQSLFVCMEVAVSGRRTQRLARARGGRTGLLWVFLFLSVVQIPIGDLNCSQRIEIVELIRCLTASILNSSG